MAIVALRCPSCNGEIELDDSREYGFCTFCGSKVMIQEEIQKIKVVHTGTVTLDDTAKSGNYMALADSAFKNKNYEEAYSYYTKVLECDASSWQAVFGKGLSAAYMSTPENSRVNELFNAIEDAKSLLFKSENRIAAYVTIQRKAVDFANCFCNSSRMSTFPSIDAAKSYFTAVERSVALILYVLNILDNAVISRDAETEAYYKSVIDNTLDICVLSLKNVRYLVGYQGVRDRRGNIKSEPVYNRLAPVCEKEIKGYIQSLKNMYNNLPGTLSKIAEFDSEIEKLRASIDDYDASLNAFFLANPQDEKTYRHPGLFGAKKKRAAIEMKFSSELIEKKELAEKCREDMAVLVKNKKQFISANTKK